MEEGKIASWEKQEGDELNEGDVLATIETDKATMDFETPEAGYLAKILVPAGSENIPLRTVLFW
jgi:pyruvate dehydrogenase E2 component (dihydrolipoamide acetyltransferase)